MSESDKDDEKKLRKAVKSEAIKRVPTTDPDALKKILKRAKEK